MQLGASMRRLRGMAPSAPLLFITALAIATVLFVADAVRLDGLRLNSHTVLGRDFVNVWLGGTLVWSHQDMLVYDINGYRKSLQETFHISDVYAYSYPPHSLFLASFFALFPYGIALGLWSRSEEHPSELQALMLI